MRCSKCSGKDTRVLESRLSHEGKSVRRRRHCDSCGYRFTTYEKVEDFFFQIRKKDGNIEPYNRGKALRALQVACSKRTVSLEDLEFLLDSIERKIQDLGERVISSQALGELLLERLNKLDKVAYVRFASVYKDFKDPKEFVRELKELSEGT